MGLTPEQTETVQTQAFYEAMATEIASVLTAMVQRGIGFDGKLYLDIGGVPVAVKEERNDIVIFVGVGEDEPEDSAAYTLQMPRAWITG